MTMMANLPLSERIGRVFAGACVGDALGAATECMHPDEVLAVFGGPVRELRDPPPRAQFALGLARGKLTDDATQMLAMARRLIAANGRPTVADAVDGILDWASDEEVFRRFAGPTTRLAVEQLRAGVEPAIVASPAVYSCTYGTSNGGAMRAPAAGCARPGDPVGAAELAAVLSAPTHNTQIAYAGAGAVAASIAVGLTSGLTGGAAEAAMIEAAHRGIVAGEAYARTNGRVVGGPGIRRRLDLAVGIGEAHRGDLAGAAAELTDVVGNGVAMAEAVPHAFGLVIAASGNPWEAIVAAVNGGNDSDTIAMIAGAVAAAWWQDGEAVPPAILAEVESANGLDLRQFANAFTAALFPGKAA
ncbi:ADP-ribosylglycohydrolase family protein [Kaistia sp. MMO-174]|uniref:ADP-ribosylglycohydrolase family protein n=1 Tax=Kaistia sp. MMO-174 TaxID=3081256 RepID=UPI001AC2091D|nr:ADP-ribosylglycohydrolase family protein [Hyphomicrobiales bacterium]